MVEAYIKTKKKRKTLKKIEYFTNVFLSIAMKPKPTGKVFRKI